MKKLEEYLESLYITKDGEPESVHDSVENVLDVCKQIQLDAIEATCKRCAEEATTKSFKLSKFSKTPRMKISKKEEDFRIYVENDKGQYISSEDVLASEESLSKKIYFRIYLHPDFKWSISLTREEIKDLAELINEVCKHL